MIVSGENTGGVCVCVSVCLCVCQCPEPFGETTWPILTKLSRNSQFTKLLKYSAIKMYYLTCKFEQLGFHDDVMAAILL